MTVDSSDNINITTATRDVAVHLTKDKFTLINDAFNLGAYDTVVQESCKIFEIVMKRLYCEGLGKFDSKTRRDLMEAEFSEGSQGVDSYSFGQLVGLFHRTKFFHRWGMFSGRDTSIVAGINFGLINDLRNRSAHKLKGQEVGKPDAEYTYASLKLLLALLGYTEYERSIVTLLERRPIGAAPSQTTQPLSSEGQRIATVYDVLDSRERRRIDFQRKLLLPTDLAILGHVWNTKPVGAVLDVGCNDGNYLASRLREFDFRGRAIGVDSHAPVVEVARDSHSEGYFFFCEDCESDGFVDGLRRHMAQVDVENFDLAVVSMLLLHLRQPFKFLQRLRPLLGDGGTIFIRDMDDGLTLAYPDPKNLVGRMLEINSRLPGTGCRESGRQIYSLLKRAGYRNIVLHSETVDTIDMSYDERALLFNTNFSYIKGDLTDASEADPDSFSDDWKWAVEHYDELEELFHSSDFYYRMGTMAFTAEK